MSDEAESTHLPFFTIHSFIITMFNSISDPSLLYDSDSQSQRRKADFNPTKPFLFFPAVTRIQKLY
jgi:hypothetical protein